MKSIDLIDRRSPEVIKRRQTGVFDDIEYRSAYIVARLLGEHVEIIDDGTQHSSVDFKIEYSDGHGGIGEVWLDSNEKHAAMANELRKKNGNYPYIIFCETLNKSWQVGVSEGTKIANCEKKLPMILKNLEDQGADLSKFTRIENMPDDCKEVAELKKLKILNIVCYQPREDKSEIVLCQPPISGDPKNFLWEHLLEYVEDTLFSDKLVTHLQKLSKNVETEPSNIERHFMFCLTNSSPGDVWHTLSELAKGRFRDPDLPTRNPKLPKEISHLWIMNLLGKSVETVICWFPDRGWIYPPKHWKVI